MSDYSEQLERLRAFDAIIDATDSLLSHPEVQRQLGQTAIDLLAENNQAFLPNVHNNRVIVPRVEKDANGMALLPLLHPFETTGLFIADKTLARATPRKLQLMGSYLVSQGHSDNELTCVVSDAEKVIDNEKNYIAQTLPSDAFTYGLGVMDQRTNTMYSTRPLVLVEAVHAPNVELHYGVTMVHEYRHGLDHEQDVRLPADLRADMARNELRAYYTVARLFDALANDSIYDTEIKSKYDAYAVEERRRAYNPLDDPFATPEALISDLEAMGVMSGL